MGYLVVNSGGDWRVFRNTPVRRKTYWVDKYTDDPGIQISPSSLGTHMQDRTWEDEPCEI